MSENFKREAKSALFILLGCIVYSLGTVCFIFPNGLLLGGTSGVSIILTSIWSITPGTMLSIINLTLLVVAFFVLGKGVAVKTLVGSIFTIFFISFLERVFAFEKPLIANNFHAAMIGAVLVAIASGLIFYVDASSGGTDIIALIVHKYWKINVGKALLITDFFIVVAGGVLSGWIIGLSSLIGLLIKTFGIDFVVSIIQKWKNKSNLKKEKST